MELQNGSENDVCHCNEEKFGKFLNLDYGHIITGDLDIISNLELKKICVMEQSLD